jgi:hypothetical protein
MVKLRHFINKKRRIILPLFYYESRAKKKDEPDLPPFLRRDKTVHHKNYFASSILIWIRDEKGVNFGGWGDSMR